MAKKRDEYREKFVPGAESALDKEIEDALGGMSIEELYDQSNQPEKSVKGTRTGKVISIGKDDIFVDFGGKSQGVASITQFLDVEPPEVGDVIEFNVDRYDPREGLLILTRKGAKQTNVNWETLEVGQVIEAVVSGSNKGGLELEVKGMRAFMPAGQVEMFHVPDFADYIGKRFEAEVTQFDRERKNIILSRRNILEREKEAAKEKLMLELAEGQTRRGTVRNVMDFGAFVDLGGVDGLLHVSEMAHRRVKSATEIVKTGDIVDVKILKIDKETGKLSLSLKQAMPDPWLDIDNKYPVGSALTGRVTRVESFGAFVEVEEGVEGLLPVSEMSWQRIRHPSDVVKEGDTIKLVVLSVDPAARRMSMSFKQAGPDPWSTVNDRYAIDMIVDGKVTRIVDFGAFVELEPGLEGLVHVSELSYQHVRTPGDVVKIGQDVKVRVLDIDKDARRVSLSMKGTEMAQTAPTAPASTSKKKRPQLRGGLDR